MGGMGRLCGLPESHMYFSRAVRNAALSVFVLSLGMKLACAQATNTPNIPNDPRAKNGVTNEQLQKLAWLRYLQGRSGSGGGGVKRGVPQFIPFGGQMPIGNQNYQGSSVPTQGQGGAAGGVADPDANQSKKSVAEKKAEYEAAREAKRQKAKERAEKRKAELAERRAKAAAGN